MVSDLDEKAPQATRWLRLSLSLPIYLHLYGCGHRKYVSSGVSSSLSGGGLAYGGLPSYTLHLGKRFMEHKSGGLPALPSLFCNGMEERSSLYSRCYSQCPRWDVLFPFHCTGLVTSACPCESSYKSSIRISKTQKL